MKKTAVVLMSGGMDSAVSAAIAKKDGWDIAALHTTYGQKTTDKELKCFNLLCDHISAVSKLVVNIGHLKAIGGSSLTDENIQVSDHNPEYNDIPRSYVPFRNGNLLAIAASWAEILNAEAIYIGAMEEDSSGYPDCRESFIRAFEIAINQGTKPETKIKIITPLLHLEKSEVVKLGLELNVPFEHTWSCYKKNDEACGICDSCTLRLNGFKKAETYDPIKYANIFLP